MRRTTANALTVGLLTAGAIGALSLVAVADAQAPRSLTRGMAVRVYPMPAVTEHCDKQTLTDRVVGYLGQASQVYAQVTQLPPRVGGQSLGGLIQISPNVPCSWIPRFVAHELGHELDRQAGTFPTHRGRPAERIAECLADRAFPRVGRDSNPVHCTPAEVAIAARLAPSWKVRNP